ncbi:ATPase [Alphaproteobacteria bacterium]|nr:ATPase [Alphaproteobacteria bacterium]
MYRKRTIEETIKKASNNFSVVMLTGPRQVGKTTVLQNCDSNRKYVTLDNLADRKMAIEDPDLFLQKYEPPVFIDGVQYAPNLFSSIKLQVDQQKKKGMYWLTGSQQFHLMKGVSESLAGRIAILKLQGFSQQEKFDFSIGNVFLDTQSVLNCQPMKINLMDLYKIIWRGSSPDLVCSDDIDWEMFYDSYVQSYLERDVRDLGAVSNELTFLKFMRAIAARTGQLLNYSDISRDVGVSSPTVKSWLSILQTSGIIYLLEPYYANLTNRMTKMPKIYFLDTGLACYLTNWQTYQALESGAMNGAIFETYVVSEILKSFWFHGKRAPLFFYRDKDQKEIDLIIENNWQLIPIEIKKKTVPDKSDIRNFDVLTSYSSGYENGFVVCLAQDYSFVTERVRAIPIGYL